MAERNPSDDQAAFGVFPQLKRNRAKQDREAAKNVPIDLARGALAGVLGAPGDIESLVRMLPYLDEKTVLPTSEDIEKRLPLRSETPVSKAATGLGILGGGFYTGPGSPLRVAGALPAAVRHGAEEFAKASVAGVPHVIKPKGGNWLSGGPKEQIRTPEGDLGRLRVKVGYSLEPEKQLKKLTEKYTPEALAALSPDIRVGVERAINETRDAVAVNNWIDSNLKNYVKKQMATPEDPVRKLAEEGIIHTPLRDNEGAKDFLRAERVAEGFPAEGMARSPLAKQWEDLADDSIRVTKAGAIQDQANTGAKLEKARAELEAHKQQIDRDFLARMSDLAGNQTISQKGAEMLSNMPFFQKAEILGDIKTRELQSKVNELLAREQGFEKRAGELNPFVEKLDPETRLYSGGLHDLGFDHIVDVLKEDVAAGRIRPEQLNKVSMEQAVRRTYEYDQEMARKMREAAIKQTEGFPLHKEYPEGYRWIELAKPKITVDTPLPEGFRWLEPKGGYERLEGPSILDPQRTRTYLGETKEDALKVAEDRSTLGSDQVKMLEDALKYEGETMGHCVGGYCPDVLEGRSRIFSLRDAKGEPHVTIEVQPNRYAPRHEDVKQYMTAAEEEAKALPHGYTDRDVSDIAVRMAKENAPQNIIQIKGKQNAKPKNEYLPYVQDFVKSGKWSDVGDFYNTGLTERNAVFTPTEVQGFADLGHDVPMYLSKEDIAKLRQARGDTPPAEGMKRGGKVSISNNPDTMMLAVNNQKLAKGGKVVKFIEDVAPTALDRLSMVFGNKLPLNMNTTEVENLVKRFPEPVVDRVNMAHKDVLKRTPELQEAAARIEAGDMSADEYARLVQRYKPVTPYESVPAPATREEILAALAKTSREAEGLPRKETYFGKPSATLKEGDPVGLRLDIPSYNQANTWVVTAHGPRKSPVSGGAGTRIGYEPVAMATDVDFSVSPKAALGIAKGAEKNTIATMEGKWKPTSSDEAFTLAKEYLKSPEWRQVGMDPERHSFFYDRETMAPVTNADEVIQIGPLVLAKNPKYGKLEDFKYADGGDVHMADGGLSKLIRALPKSKAEIEAIAQRMAPQLLGEFVRGDKGTQSVAGKTQKQFAKEKEMVHDIRPTGAERPLPKPVDIEQLKGNVVIGIPGDPTISGQTVHSIGGIPLESPSPQHGGPLYGLGRDDAFWASGLGAANRVQNLAREAGMQYDAPVLGKYIMMGPESINYAQHFADANLSAIDPSKMTKGQIESFNNLVREGYPYKKSGESFQRVFPAFPGIENPAEAYLHFSIDPELRKHFNALMQMPTVTEKHGLPSGIDVRHAITEPDLRDLETGVTGKSIGRMKPEITQLGLSEHPTYSHDIPGEFMGSSKYPIPYELSFPDTVRAIRENPKQAPHEFGSLKMVGPRQIIDQQMIDEIKQYEEQIKRLTGKKKGGTVHKAAGGAITGDDLIIEERPL